MIFFVLSLEEGFYAYQFRQMGWSILSLMVIVGSGHGLLLSLWKVRIWFIYTVVCLYLRDVVDFLVAKFIGGPPIHHLSPKSSILGFIVGGLCAFGFYFQVADVMLQNFWFNVSPIKISFTPFDYSSVHVDTSSALFKQKQNEVLGNKFDASPIEIHLFIITVFIAVVAPFG